MIHEIRLLCNEIFFFFEKAVVSQSTNWCITMPLITTTVEEIVCVNTLFSSELTTHLGPVVFLICLLLLYVVSQRGIFL